MDNQTNWTPSPDDNLLGLTDQNNINEKEAKGIALAELFIFQLDTDVTISICLILEIHKVAFSELYEWAGKWRTVDVAVGRLEPPKPLKILQLMYQFVDNLNYKINTAINSKAKIDTLIYAHYEFIRIHPFNNGNGRTGRMLMNLVALKLGFRPFELYQREGQARKIYIAAMQSADEGDLSKLSALIAKELTTF